MIALQGNGWQFTIYHALVEDYEKMFRARSPNLSKEYWKERQKKGLGCNLQDLIYLMNRRKFELIFLTTKVAVFQKRKHWWEFWK